MQDYFVQVLSAALLVGVAYGSADPEKPNKDKKQAMVYQVVVGATAKEFERDDVASATSGGDPVGTTVLWLNGDPIEFYRRGLLVFGANQWLRQGENQLTLTGKHEKPVYIKV